MDKQSSWAATEAELDSDDLAPARGVVTGILLSVPVWMAGGFVLALVSG